MTDETPDPKPEPRGGEVVDEDGVEVEIPENERVISEVVESVEVDQGVPLVGDDVDPLPAIPDPEGFGQQPVEIYHPDTPGDDTSTSTRGAFEETWKAKGWRIVAGRRDDGQIVLEPEGPTRVTRATPVTDDVSDASPGTDSDSEQPKSSRSRAGTKHTT